MSQLKLVVVFVLLFISGCSPENSDVAKTQPAPDASEDHTNLVLENESRNNPMTIVMAADPWCPHNCVAGSAREGYMVDIAREILGEKGYELTYINVSWARALQMTREGRLDAVVGALKTDAPDFIFPATAQGLAAIALFTHPDNSWHYAGLESLRDQQLLVINSYSYTRELDRYIDEHRNSQNRVWVISGPSPLERAIYLLDRDRTDIFAEDIYVMDWWQKNNRAAVTPPRNAGLVGESEAFVAFSPARADAQMLADLLAAGTRERIENGRAQEILDNYGLILWNKKH